MQGYCRIITGKRLYTVVFDTYARRCVISPTTQNCIADHLKTPLQPDYTRLTTANNTLDQ